MVEKICIIWVKTNKNMQKFDMGIYTNRQTADYVAQKITGMYKVWVSEYKLSKPISGGK